MRQAEPVRAEVGPRLEAFDDVPGLADAILTQFEAGGPAFVRQLMPRLTAAAVGQVRFDVDVTPHVVHGGGVMCGQSILACMDTGMVFAMASLRDGEIVPFTTVSLTTNFERAVPADVGTVTFDASVTKAGRSVVFGQIDLFLPDGRRAASSTTTYVWL
ncbi:MAG: PaaI family thioesterase [Actinomycetota bacterium]